MSQNSSLVLPLCLLSSRILRPSAFDHLELFSCCINVQRTRRLFLFNINMKCVYKMKNINNHHRMRTTSRDATPPGDPRGIPKLYQVFSVLQKKCSYLQRYPKVGKSVLFHLKFEFSLRLIIAAFKGRKVFVKADFSDIEKMSEETHQWPSEILQLLGDFADNIPSDNVLTDISDVESFLTNIEDATAVDNSVTITIPVTVNNGEFDNTLNMQERIDDVPPMQVVDQLETPSSTSSNILTPLTQPVARVSVIQPTQPAQHQAAQFVVLPQQPVPPHQLQTVQCTVQPPHQVQYQVAPPLEAVLFHHQVVPPQQQLVVLSVEEIKQLIQQSSSSSSSSSKTSSLDRQEDMRRRNAIASVRYRRSRQQRQQAALDELAALEKKNIVLKARYTLMEEMHQKMKEECLGLMSSDRKRSCDVMMDVLLSSKKMKKE